MRRQTVLAVLALVALGHSASKADAEKLPAGSATAGKAFSFVVMGDSRTPGGPWATVEVPEVSPIFTDLLKQVNLTSPDRQSGRQIVQAERLDEAGHVVDRGPGNRHERSNGSGGREPVFGEANLERLELQLHGRGLDERNRVVGCLLEYHQQLGGGRKRAAALNHSHDVAGPLGVHLKLIGGPRGPQLGVHLLPAAAGHDRDVDGTGTGRADQVGVLRP